MIPADFRGAATLLAPGDVPALAAELQCVTAIVHAFSDIESAGGGFIPGDGRPKILFEAHAFHTLTQGAFDDTAPNVSSPAWNRSLYGAGGAHQYDRLAIAFKLAPAAALQSCSIGRYQVMASNYHMIGFARPEDMWAAFCDSEKAHLDGFGAFCRAAGLVPALRTDPPGFVRLATGYNGAGERANGYDQKLEVAFDHYAGQGEDAVPSPLAPIARTEVPTLPALAPAGPTPREDLELGMVGDDVAALQRELGGIDVDRRFGGETFAAVEAYQRAHLLYVDGEAGPLTQAALAAGYAEPKP
jgi:hypothetical protein